MVIQILQTLNKRINLYRKASITVEASLSFTLTIFILFMMLGPLLIIKTSSDFLLEMNEISKVRCNYEMYKYYSKGNDVYDEAWDLADENENTKSSIDLIKNVFTYSMLLFDFNQKYTEKEVAYKNIKSIYDINKKVYDENTGIAKFDLEVEFELPYNVLFVNTIRKRFINHRRAFIGSDGDRFDNVSNEGDYIYLANNYVNSDVYHTDINCTYLIKKVKSVKYKNVSNERNYNGGKYNKCGYCFKNIKLKDDTTCYITEYGDKFHYKENCPLMTAYVTKVPKDYIEKYNLRICSRCEKLNGG